MQAVVLAAGMGSRLGKYTENSTKCMVEVNGKSLLERIFDSLRNAGIKKVVIVTGYCAEQLNDHARAIGGDFDITFINNDRYATTNNIYSLFLASEHMSEEDTILFESDLIFDSEIVSELIRCPDPNVVTVSKFENWMDGTVTTFDSENRVTAFIEKSKFNWDNCSSYYKTVNIYKLSKEFFSNWYLPFLKAYIQTCGNNAYYEMVLKIIANINDSNLKVMDVSDKKWYEIDTPQDLQVAQTLFGENKLRSLSERYGGYWRFQDIRDYCYLVNPWFPDEKMISEMKHSFTELLTQYPSGSRIISTAMASLLDVSEDYVVTGNGAAELIRIIMRNLKGSYYITSPSFNEYINSAETASAEIGLCENESFEYNKEFILKQSENCDIVIIINPDNPSGHFISENEMYEILDALYERNQKVIVDESFVDFADSDIRYTLIKNATLLKYPNLSVIKSISKSYGVPGIRLGALCSSDTALLKSVAHDIPIWNINSFAEFFLQICGKYKKSYINACDMIASERARFSSLLDKTGLFVVYPSQANYIMCRMKKGTAESLCEFLIENNFLIKNLNGKNGCDNGEYIRIAIKKPEENDELISVVYEYIRNLI
ncbi:MAG: aminotransferase class I/II-fold pyridoxal phosphate-dependent enzyme [Oscillospiraceae bacterium]|nr:aminotransferase class I/II-fold pyridoxal phosphate-dependent enzyme [Oscillospiraceae bacterium]